MRVLFPGKTLLVLGILIPASVSAQWLQTAGPYGGRGLAFLTKTNRVYVGTEGGGVFYSTNTGRTWVRSDLGFGVRQALTLTDQGTTIFAGTNVGVFRSEDDGASWQQANGGQPEVSVTAMGTIGPYILAWFKTLGLLRSSDQGDSWQVVFPVGSIDEPPARVLLRVDSLVFLGKSQGCFVSADSGFYWESRSEGMEVNRHVRCFGARDGMLMAGTNRDLYRSTDHGMNWVKVVTGLPAGVSTNALAPSGLQFFAGTDAGVYQTVNNGDLWLPVSSGLTDSLINALTISGNALLAGTDAGVFRSVDNGANWTEENEGLKATRVRALLARGPYVFAGSRSSGVYRTSDEGQTWIPVNNGLLNREVSSLINTEKHIIAGTVGSGVFRSDDFGETWQSVSLPPSSPNINVMTISGTFIFAGTDNGLCMSGDGGDTWTCSGLDTVEITSLTVSGSFLFVGAVDSGLYRSSNNGDTWQKVDPFFTTDSTISSLAVNGPYIFAGTLKRGIFRSADNGNTWHAVNVGMADTTVSAILVTDYEMFIGTFGEGAFVTTDNGDSWEIWNENLQKKELLSLLLVGSTIYGGTAGSGVEKRQIPPPAPALVFPFDEAEDVPVPAALSWTPVSGATSYDLQICLDGLFDSLAVNETGIATITFSAPDIARNTHYFWRVRARGPGGNGLFSIARSFSTTNAKVFVNEPMHTYPANPVSSTDYRLIGLPGIPDRSFSSLFTGVQGTSWNMFDDTGADPPDHLAAVHPDSIVGYGKGYWTIAQGSLAFSGTVAMPVLDMDGNCSIDVDDGWNIITVPHDLPVPTDAIRAVNGDAGLMFWSYSGDEGWFADTSGALIPFEGYYFKNETGLDFLIIPYPFPARLLSMPQPVVSWKMQIVLETFAGNDRQNFIGISPDALPGRDPLDLPKPAVPGFGPYLTFAEGDEALGSDFRPDIVEGQIWSFDVVNQADGPAVLRFPRETRLPEGLSALLVNTSTNERTDVIADSAYEYQSTRTVTRFMLLVGPGEFGKNYLDQTIPEEFLLSQNYPNPFNPETTLNVDIPYESSIRVAVFSVLGEEVTDLASGRHTPGRYAYVWDGRDRFGNPVASGVYLARFEVEGVPMFLRKMMLIR